MKNKKEEGNMINQKIVDEAFKFYEIDTKYKGKTYETIEEINKNKTNL